MSGAFVALILGLFAIRAFAFRGARRWRYAHSPMLDEKITKLEAQVADLQEQAEQDRAAIGRLEEERDFLRQLYPAQGSHAAS